VEVPALSKVREALPFPFFHGCCASIIADVTALVKQIAQKKLFVPQTVDF
jgi:hypothetical protein